MLDVRQRLLGLRARLTQDGVDGLLLATGDEHITEFVAPYAQRLAWLTGFTGSTASAAVLANRAAIFVDSRYTQAVRASVDAGDWSYQDVPETSVGAWIAANAPQGSRIGNDARLVTRSALASIEEALAGREVTLVPLEQIPVDAIWADQPARPATPVFAHGIEFSGREAAAKHRDVAEWLASLGGDACVLVALDSIAWLFNIRGSDIDIAPLNYAFAIVHRDGTADLFIDTEKLDAKVRLHLGDSVRLAPYDDFYAAITRLAGKTVSIDPLLTPLAVVSGLQKGGATVRHDRDPTVRAKAVKNFVEIDGFKRAHIRDGVALTRFLHWFSVEAPRGDQTELSVSKRLTAFRGESDMLHSVSFDPISAVDANAALPHYWPSEESDRAIGPDSIYLVDSGGQYPDGTTDVTRTVAVGRVSGEVKDRFTRVLKGYIALETTTFPEGTFGHRLDAIARAPLWAAGVDFGHGVGHGVGQFLNVHEGPAFIMSHARPGETPIEAGMILSNEPGYYKPGEYGIRTENLLVVVARDTPGGDRPMLGFEPLTLAPIDRRLIDPTLLSGSEVEWIDAYHAKVRALVGPLLPSDVQSWLEIETSPLSNSDGRARTAF